MPRPDTWSDRARPGKLQHHSARGNMPRNAGDFTRGSQLITHEFMMWFASAKMPLLVWFFTFLVALSIVLALLLHEHEVQMILMRIYAAGWAFMEFSPSKVINLTVPSGEVIPAPISMVASHPDVVIAWNKLMRAREQGFYADAALNAARAEQARHDSAERVQEGALRFVDDALACFAPGTRPPAIPPELAVSLIGELLRRPSPEEARRIGALPHAEGYGPATRVQAIADPPPGATLPWHWRRVLSGYRQSFWRVGYRRQLWPGGW